MKEYARRPSCNPLLVPIHGVHEEPRVICPSPWAWVGNLALSNHPPRSSFWLDHFAADTILLLPRGQAFLFSWYCFCSQRLDNGLSKDR